MLHVRRTGAALLVSAALLSGGATARVLASDDLDPLVALDAALPRVTERAERSVVPLEVEREDKPDRPLTQIEKMRLGIGATRIFDPRYFARPKGACSAVVLSSGESGSILVTSTWNVRDARSVHVVLADGTKVACELLGRDENLDVQLLRAKDAKGLVPIATAPRTRVGQFAILVGRGGERSTTVVTFGNVSAVQRFKGDALQVSCRMNYGNVGGAVVDLDGRLIGIATRLTDRAYQGLNSGVGFAAPVERLVASLKDLEAGKNVAKRKNPFLGIQGDLAPLPAGKTGTRIKAVVKGGAAEKAGIKDGDIIKIFNGVEVKDFLGLRDEIEKLEVGDKVIVTIEREDKGEKDFTIELGPRPDGEE